MKVLFPGSFDPMHEGHLKIIERASRVFDDVVVLIAQNPQKKNSDIVERTNNAKKLLTNLNIDNVKIDFWNGQIMEYYEKYYFDAIIRSIRDSSDLDWEEYIANEYRKENIDADVLYFLAEKPFKNIKSSINLSKKNKSLFVFDVDGTILNDEKKLTWSIKRVFRKLQENGHVVLIATGRLPSQVFQLCRELNFQGHILGSNGAAVYEIENKKYNIFKEFIPVDDIEILIQKAYQIKRELIWTNGKKIYRVYFGDNLKKDIKDKLYFIGGEKNPKYDNWEECKHTLNEGVIQLSIKAESWLIEKIKKELNKKLSNKVIGVETSGVYYQVNHSKINKFKAIEKFQEKYFIKNFDTYAFGDSENDKEMIKNAGHGIAMGNARKILKEVAQEIIGDNNCESIEDYLIKKGFISE